MSNKTSKWDREEPQLDVIDHAELPAGVVDYGTNHDEVNAAEAIRLVVTLAGKTRASALRLLLTPLAAFCYENGLGVETPVQLLRAAFADYQKARAEAKEVQ